MKLDIASTGIIVVIYFTTSSSLLYKQPQTLRTKIVIDRIGKRESGKNNRVMGKVVGGFCLDVASFAFSSSGEVLEATSRTTHTLFSLSLSAVFLSLDG